jgi:hypothetical protein
MRDIADLRIQYFCEYRYYLKRKYGNSSSIDSIRGEWLHSKIRAGTSISSIKQIRIKKIIIIGLAILFVLLLYIFG